MQRRVVKRASSILIMITLLASQAFGAALCPSICDSLKKVTIEKTSSHCHREKPAEDSSQEMPIDCNVMAMLDALSTFNISSNALEVSRFDFENSLFLDTEEFQLSILTFTNSRIAIFSELPPIRKQSLYILNQSFLI